jgi:hypothetical protein
MMCAIYWRPNLMKRALTSLPATHAGVEER